MLFQIRRTSDTWGERSPIEGAKLVSPYDGNIKPGVWTLEVASLEDLLKLYPRIIVWGTTKGAVACIEIYDSYRE